MKLRKRMMALLLSLCMMAAGTSAFAAGSAIVTRSTAPDGSAVPYTMYIATTSASLRATGSDTVTYTLNVSTTRNVKIYCYVTVQRYAGNNVWINASNTRYYEQNNCNEFDVSDSVSGLPGGQYRVVVDYYASLNGYTDYIYAESNYCYL